MDNEVILLHVGSASSADMDGSRLDFFFCCLRLMHGGGDDDDALAMPDSAGRFHRTKNCDAQRTNTAAWEP